MFIHFKELVDNVYIHMVLKGFPRIIMSSSISKKGSNCQISAKNLLKTMSKGTGQGLDSNDLLISLILCR